MKRSSWSLVLLGTVGGILFFWMFVMKLVARLAARLGRSAPCPAAVGWLVDNPLRRYYMQPVLGWTGIQPGEVVLELGPGPGVFTVPAAKKVGPQGRLVAVDIQPEMIARTQQRLHRAAVTNVELHLAGAYSLPLNDGSVDRAFLISVLPEVPDPTRALAELHRVLRPGGILSITAEFPDPDYWFLSETIEQLEAAGFTLVEKYGNIWRYTSNFRRVEGNAVGSSYYIARSRKLLREFDRVAGRAGSVFAKRFDPLLAYSIAACAHTEYARIIPQLPYIGGKQNPHTFNLVGAAWFLALHRSMQTHGRSLAETGELCAEMYAAWLDAYPTWLLRLRGWYTFTLLGQRQIARRAQESQARLYAGDWVFATVPPDHGFGRGVDFSECGILKFLEAQGATDLMPYLCPLDFIMSERMSLGLVRTATLAGGAPYCNFRFRRGRPTHWPAAPPPVEATRI
jgi:SAM-dependent methyltransferase